MSLELSGTTGVKGVAGSVSAPSIVGDDNNTGISFPAADTIKFSTGGVERMSITNSGITGISGGKILQVKSTTKTDIFSSTAVQTYTDITGLSVDITPSATTSKILVTASISFGLDVSHSLVVFRFMRDSTPIAIADAANNRPRGTFTNKPGEDAVTSNASGIHLDSPSSTSQLTYKVQFYDYHSNTFYVNRSFRHFDASTYDMVATSNITVQEVGA